MIFCDFLDTFRRCDRKSPFDYTPDYTPVEKDPPRYVGNALYTPRQLITNSDTVLAQLHKAEVHGKEPVNSIDGVYSFHEIQRINEPFFQTASPNSG